MILAPMAGITDAAYRRVCREFGAALTVGEMVASSEHLWNTDLSQERYEIDSSDPYPVIQLVGSEPEQFAAGARLAQKYGAKIVDLNFGCPARMVCGKACGSALMQEPEKARAIFKAVAGAVTIPVTVKIRTGWDDTHKNAPEIAKLAEDAGFAAVTIHGRTRAQRFTGAVSWDDMAKVVEAVQIPVIVNGDISTPEQARDVLQYTKAAGVMIGRGANGNPWLFARAQAAIDGVDIPPEPDRQMVCDIMLAHLNLHCFYGQNWHTPEHLMKTFRKHARWYMERLISGASTREQVLLQNAVRVQTQEEMTEILQEFSQC